MITETKDGVIVHLYVQPRSSKSEVIGPFNGALKIKIKAPPVDGKANEEIINLLADIFDIPPKKVHLLKGDTSRLKSVLIQGISASSAKKYLNIE